MTYPKNTDENGKSKEWQTPMEMPGVKKGTYNGTMAQSSGSQTAADSNPSDPAGKALTKVTEAAIKLASQSDKSG